MIYRGQEARRDYHSNGKRRTWRVNLAVRLNDDDNPFAGMKARARQEGSVFKFA